MGTSAVLPKTGILQTRPRPLSSHAHTMEGNALLFQNDMTYKTTIDGTINGESFQVIGEGTSKAPHGDFNIHAVCTTGKLPFFMESAESHPPIWISDVRQLPKRTDPLYS